MLQTMASSASGRMNGPIVTDTTIVLPLCLTHEHYSIKAQDITTTAFYIYCNVLHTHVLYIIIVILTS